MTEKEFTMTLTPEMQTELKNGNSITIAMVDQDDQPRMKIKIIPENNE